MPGSWAQSVNLRPLLDVHALAGCQTTYLDLGSNIGNWITALFSNRSLNGELNNALGVYGITRQAGEICAWGFEPNPAHYERLHAIERRLHRQSLRRVHFFHAAIASTVAMVRLTFGVITPPNFMNGGPVSSTTALG